MLHYEVVDVFTDRPLAGNPLAVVLDADDLSGEQLQALAREFNLSETAFPLPSQVADYRLRSFTPTAELPFAGHPSIGSARTLVRLGRLPAGSVLRERGAGLLPLSVGLVEVSLTGGKPTLGGDLDAGQLLAAVGLEPADGAGRTRLAGCGLEFGYLPVTEDAVARAMPDPRALGAALGSDGCGLCVYAWDVDRRTAHARVFAGVSAWPRIRPPGQPLWGSASTSSPPGSCRPERRRTRSTRARNCSGPLRCTAVVQGQTAVQVTVTGSVVSIAKGTIRVP